MSRGDIKKVDVGGANVCPTRRFAVAASTATIYAGEPVGIKFDGSSVVSVFLDGEPTTSAPSRVIGIAATDGTHTSTATGFVDVYVPIPDVTVFRGKAKTSTDADTQAEIDALINKCIPLDLTSSVFTVDAGASHANTDGCRIVGGNAATAEVDFVFRSIVVQGATS